MAYDASYEWAQPPRWRRWFARLFALLALAAAGVGVYAIARDASVNAPPKPATLQPQVQAVAASTTALARRLVALHPHSHTDRALAALREAQADRRSAAVALATADQRGRVADGESLDNALAAHRAYLTAVAKALRHPGHADARALRAAATRDKAAWNALPDPAGIPDAIRGYGHVEALVARHHG